MSLQTRLDRLEHGNQDISDRIDDLIEWLATELGKGSDEDILGFIDALPDLPGTEHFPPSEAHPLTPFGQALMEEGERRLRETGGFA